MQKQVNGISERSCQNNLTGVNKEISSAFQSCLNGELLLPRGWFRKFFQYTVEQLFGNRIDVCCGFIQNKKFRLAEHCLMKAIIVSVQTDTISCRLHFCIESWSNLASRLSSPASEIASDSCILEKFLYSNSRIKYYLLRFPKKGKLLKNKSDFRVRSSGYRTECLYI